MIVFSLYPFLLVSLLNVILPLNSFIMKKDVMNSKFFLNLLCSLDSELCKKFGYLVYKVVQSPIDESVFVIHSRDNIFNIHFMKFIISWCKQNNSCFSVRKAPFLGCLELRIYIYETLDW